MEKGQDVFNFKNLKLDYVIHNILDDQTHNWKVQADITAAAIDQQDASHILACLPTGMGKTIPMLVTACLLPPGDIHHF